LLVIDHCALLAEAWQAGDVDRDRRAVDHAMLELGDPVDLTEKPDLAWSVDHGDLDVEPAETVREPEVEYCVAGTNDAGGRTGAVAEQFELINVRGALR
jgi:hypothetical protein